ncbi:MAG: hypothetical protein CSA32_00540 [Desulfobulbus propionicus]|nr:MAG: hypothetical protein CSA32_00540 [Desulfobulbus propionicus]
MKSIQFVVYATVLVSVLLAGCGSNVTKSRIATYKTLDPNHSEWKIHATADTGSFGSAISIFINNENVINGDLNITTGIGHFSGSYEGKTIDAECSLDQRGIGMFNRCKIFIDSEEFTEFTF